MIDKTLKGSIFYFIRKAIAIIKHRKLWMNVGGLVSELKLNSNIQ